MLLIMSKFSNVSVSSEQKLIDTIYILNAPYRYEYEYLHSLERYQLQLDPWPLDWKQRWSGHQKEGWFEEEMAANEHKITSACINHQTPTNDIMK